MALVTLTTDFGATDPYVGIMKGVIAARAPGVPIVDLSHGIPPQDVRAGALVLRHAAPYFPERTVHVAVIDPGVGSARRPIAIETRTALLVGPDNGLLSLAAPPEAVRRAVLLAAESFFLHPRSASFHGRDIFAPVGAALAMGIDLAELGPAIETFERLTFPEPRRQGGELLGEVIYVDHFGNLTTNIGEVFLLEFPPERLSITIACRTFLGLAGCYAAGQLGEPVAIVNSWGLLEVAVRNGSAEAVLGVGVGDPVRVRWVRP